MSDVIITTTTSVVDSGLSDRLTEAFETYQAVYTLIWDPRGSGAAMQAAREGKADVVVSHDRYGELQFISQGFAPDRYWVFYNYFVMVGPTGGPIGQTTLQDGFKYIATHTGTTIFVSRGNTGLSGTYVREQQIWARLNAIYPTTPPTYPPSNVNNNTPNPSMLGTLNYTFSLVTSNPSQNAYTLTDIGTWYYFLATTEGAADAMTMLTSPNDNPEDPWASNQYVAMKVNQGVFGQPPTHQINEAGAQAFLDWRLTIENDTPYNANNAEAAVNGYLVNINPEGSPVWKQGFIYNADDPVEHDPGDSSLIPPFS